MARIRKNTRLQTREARSSLAPRKEPYWHEIHRGLALGYYRGTQGGRWLAREYTGGRYVRQSLGTADDHADADGQAVLSFAQAQKLTMGGVEPRKASGYTVGDALDGYLRDFEGRSYKETERVIEREIRPVLGQKVLDRLTTKEIRDWQRGLLKPNSDADKARKDANPKEWTRGRKATANRVLTVLKAALNWAYYHDLVESSTAWSRVKPYQRVDPPRRRYLTYDESVRFVNACRPDFRPLARAALLTGGRYGELTKMRVSDYNPDSATVHFVETKSGKHRHVPLTNEGRQLFEELTAGRNGSDPMFVHEDGSTWVKNDQQRPMRQACERAKIDPPISFRNLRTTYGSLLALEGVPLQVISKLLGHADTRVTEKHYAHLQPDHVSEALRAALPDFGGGSNKVARIDRGRN